MFEENPFTISHGLRDRVYRWLDGTLRLPDHLYIGKDCCRHHGENGKTIRRVKGRGCVICQKKSNQRYLTTKACSQGGRSTSDRRKIEEIQDRQAGTLDGDPLF